MNILLICNAGSFSKQLISFFSAENVLTVYEVTAPLDTNLLDDIVSSVENRMVQGESYDALLFISGESRNELIMNTLNFDFPKRLLDVSVANGLDFVYLSSLAVFSGVVDDHIGLDSPRSPIDLYGKSKNDFDTYVAYLRESEGASIRGIYPASFYSRNGRSSLERYLKVINDYGFFLKRISFPGELSYIDRDELIEGILDVCKSNGSLDVILSNHVSLEYLLLGEVGDGWFLRIPRMPMFFFRTLSVFLPAKIEIKLRMLLRGIRYG
ncbi:NAD-dependent epimerase/dehydratase family protein [Sulfuriflexus mobilis]|uniref:NAD-dependent epimerase/dehydratase family protein n=1 Tax=Sulfuriflexus mobilis TaxID=1811807 RepID=UPI000F82E220|nr:NAD-dependent epimerase/dehydratase family protein [Sulfuriflexus mobilis]